jgi:hypothetical protein
MKAAAKKLDKVNIPAMKKYYASISSAANAYAMAKAEADRAEIILNEAKAKADKVRLKATAPARRAFNKIYLKAKKTYDSKVKLQR